MLRFGPIDVHYDARVLVPRPWTLAQSTWAATLAATLPSGPILELCAGAGHIGLAAAVLADRDVVQVELDPVAVGFARENAERAGWGARTDVRVSSMVDALRAHERFRLVIADPPYLPSAALATWPEDPPLAIDGGEDGLRLVRVCLDVSARHLAPGGAVLLQVAGPAQAEQVRALAESDGRLRAGECRVVDDERAIIRLDRAP